VGNRISFLEARGAELSPEEREVVALVARLLGEVRAATLQPLVREAVDRVEERWGLGIAVGKVVDLRDARD
jgi:hypothetical protein